jgi:nucleoid-associated protein YgaU
MQAQKYLVKKTRKDKLLTPQIAKHIEEEQAVEKSQLESLREDVLALNIPIENMSFYFGQSVTVTGKTRTNAESEKIILAITGKTRTNAESEKIILAIGNVEDVSIVEDSIEVEQAEPDAQFYTVKKGDSLSKIAGEYYDDVKAYPLIFDANKPMLKDPSLIYPGQVLRIAAR